jgi:hypothetical protein
LQLPDVSVDNLPEFMSAIEGARSRLLAQGQREWKDWVSTSPALLAWRSFLRADPYTDRALTKPRGFPGDAVVMDFAYRHPSISDHLRKAGGLGNLIYHFTSGAPQSESARMRRDRIAQEIAGIVRSNGSRTIKVVSVAAGHARELELLADRCSPDEVSRLDFIAIDSDLASGEAIKSYAGSFRISIVGRNVFRVGASDRAWNADFAYSMGLFDYLDDRFAQRLLERMAGFVAPGGNLLVGNLCDTPSNLGYCEAVMDWWMIPRNESSMLALADGIRKNRPNCTIELEKLGDFYFLRIGLVD